MPTTTNSGVEISYAVSGSGPGLVLIHGIGGNGTTTWGEIAPRLAKDHTVVIPDLRGCGSSQRGDGALTIEELAADVATTARAAGLDRFGVVGFSLGAAVAAQLAASQPERVGSLVLVGSPPSAAGPRAKLQFELWADLVEADPRLFARLWLLTGFSPRFVAAIPTDQIDRAAHFPIEPATADQSRLNANLDFGQILGRIRARTLVVACSEDVIHPPEGARDLAFRIPDAAYVELESGHLVVLEDANRLTEVVDAFLSASDAERQAPQDANGPGVRR
jgi:pimeloyl-ACP methyl ester carboxylesterase